MAINISSKEANPYCHMSYGLFQLGRIEEALESKFAFIIIQCRKENFPSFFKKIVINYLRCQQCN